MKASKQTITAVSIAILAISLFLLSGTRFPYIDDNADSYFNSAIMEAGGAYAVCRTVNAGVSMVKESRVDVEPAGMGASLALGEAVDPIYDLTERSSDVFVTAIVSLGVQKIAHELSLRFAPPVFGILLISTLALSFIKSRRAETLVRLCMKLMVVVLLARLCLPVSSLANQFLAEKYFNPKIEEAKAGVSISSPDLEKLKDFTMPEIDGVLGTIKNGFGYIEEKASNLEGAVKSVVSHMNHIIDSLLTLTELYVTMLVVQVIILPILTLWGLVKCVNSLFDRNLPFLRHSILCPRPQSKKSAVQG